MLCCGSTERACPSLISWHRKRLMTAGEPALRGGSSVPLNSTVAAGPGETACDDESAGFHSNAGGNAGKHTVEYNAPCKEPHKRRAKASFTRLWSSLLETLCPLFLGNHPACYSVSTQARFPASPSAVSIRLKTLTAERLNAGLG